MPSSAWTKMTDLSDKRNLSTELRTSADSNTDHFYAPRRYHDGIRCSGRVGDEIANDHEGPVQEDMIVAGVTYTTYRRKWFGLLQLVLLNIVVSWDVGMLLSDDRHMVSADCQQWLSFTAVSRTSSLYFGVGESAIAWLSTGFMFAFCIASPFVDLLPKPYPTPADQIQQDRTLDTQQRWTQASHRHSKYLDPHRELDSLCRHACDRRSLRRRGVRTDHHRSRSAVRAHRSNKIL